MASALHHLTAARGWASTWRAAWPARDTESVVDLYAQDAVHRAGPFREPYIGRDAIRGYFAAAFATEVSPARVWFGEPFLVAALDNHPQHVAVGEWWAHTVDEDGPATLAGCSVLTFGPDGLLTEQRDYWAQTPGHVEPGR